MFGVRKMIGSCLRICDSSALGHDPLEDDGSAGSTDGSSQPRTQPTMHTQHEEPEAVMHAQEAEEQAMSLEAALPVQGVHCTSPRCPPSFDRSPVFMSLWLAIQHSDERLIEIHVTIWPSDVLVLDQGGQTSVQWAMRCSSPPGVVAVLLRAGGLASTMGSGASGSAWRTLCGVPMEPVWHTHNMRVQPPLLVDEKLLCRYAALLLEFNASADDGYELAVEHGL